MIRKRATQPTKRKQANSRKSAPSLSKLKKELDRLFSIYIRHKYCITCHHDGTIDE